MDCEIRRENVVPNTDEIAYEEINEAKANFDDIYTRPDPRDYFRVLGDLDYQITGQARPVFRELIDIMRRRRQTRRLKLLDLGCSYGINAALLKFDVTLKDLYERWRGKEYGAMCLEERIAGDRKFFADRLADPELFNIGHDAAAEAIEYALDVGILDNGFSQNLEEEDPDPDFTREITDTDLVITTGAVGYVSEKTFSRLADRFAARKPWICCFVIRMFTFEPIRECLDSYGYVTERLEGRVFRQRRFKDEEERQKVADNLREWGLDPTPEMENGFYHAECFLSRPKEDIDMPVNKLLANI